MNHKLPPIQLLAAFESASRHLSIKKAALELHLTPSAISQQVKTLESALGHSLFRRETRALFLTDAGLAYQEVAQKTLHQFRESQRRFDRRFNRKSIRVSVLPFIANELLIPNLNSFHKENEGVDLRIETGMSLADFESDDTDAAVRFGTGEWKGLHSRKLCDLTGTLVCTENYFDKKEPTIDTLESKTLLHENSMDDWQQVAKLVGLEEFNPKRNLFFDSDLATITAATKGLGVAIGLRPFINPLIEDGRLHTPFSQEHLIPLSCYFVVREIDRSNIALNSLFSWIKSLITNLH